MCSCATGLRNLPLPPTSLSAVCTLPLPLAATAAAEATLITAAAAAAAAATTAVVRCAAHGFLPSAGSLLLLVCGSRRAAWPADRVPSAAPPPLLASLCSCRLRWRPWRLQRRRRLRRRPRRLRRRRRRRVSYCAAGGGCRAALAPAGGCARQLDELAGSRRPDADRLLVRSPAHPSGSSLSATTAATTVATTAAGTEAPARPLSLEEQASSARPLIERAVPQAARRLPRGPPATAALPPAPGCSHLPPALLAGPVVPPCVRLCSSCILPHAPCLCALPAFAAPCVPSPLIPSMPHRTSAERRLCSLPLVCVMTLVSKVCTTGRQCRRGRLAGWRSELLGADLRAVSGQQRQGWVGGQGAAAWQQRAPRMPGRHGNKQLDRHGWACRSAAHLELPVAVEGAQQAAGEEQEVRGPQRVQRPEF